MSDLEEKARDFWVKVMELQPEQLDQGDERDIARLTALLRDVREADAKVADGYAEAAKAIELRPYALKTSKRKTAECIAAAIREGVK